MGSFQFRIFPSNAALFPDGIYMLSIVEIDNCLYPNNSGWGVIQIK